MPSAHLHPRQQPYPTTSALASASSSSAAASHHPYPQSTSSFMNPHILPPPDSVNMLDLIPDPDDDAADEEKIFRDMSFEEILEDLNARFLVNLPREEMNLLRVYWQAEQAHWFYEDYLRPLNPLLPQLSQRSFSHLIVASSPLYGHLTDDDDDEVWDQYCRYKRMVPCCGGILINADGDKVLMVRGWKSNAGWSFPRGKINSEESEEACAIREVEEETGFSLAGMVNSKDRITTQISAQTITMFIVKGIDEATVFETQTRKEIGAIEWVPFADLPTWSGKKGPKTTGVKGKKFYNVTPFVGPLKRWLSEHGINPNQKRRGKASAAGAAQQTNPSFRALEPYFDASASQAQQPHHPQHPQDHSALDNLFHRFIHKQEEELAHPDSVGAKDNKAGLQRLFQGLDVLDVLEQEDRAVPVRGNGQPPTAVQTMTTAEQKEDDALARLLGGLSTSSPAPRPADFTGQARGGGDGKANKLLAMLNAPREDAAPVTTNPPPTHQASLLAMLSPKQEPRGPAPAAPVAPASAATHPASHPIFEIKKPLSVPTSPRPQSPGQEIRARQQRALLEQITAGVSVDVPAPKAANLSSAPPMPGSAYPSSPSAGMPLKQAPYEMDQSSSGGYNSASRSSSQRISPQHHSQSPSSQHGRQPSHQPEHYGRPSVTDYTSAGQHSPHTTRIPPPPYEPISSNFTAAAVRLPQQPGLSVGSASSGVPSQSYQVGSAQLPTGLAGLSHEQQNLLNTLRNPAPATSNGHAAPTAQNGLATGRGGSIPPAQPGPTASGPNVSCRPPSLPTQQFSPPAQTTSTSQYPGAFPGRGHPPAPANANAYGAIAPAPPNTFPPNGQVSGGPVYAPAPGVAYPQHHQHQQHQQPHGLPIRPAPNQFTGNSVPMGQGYGYAGPPRPPGQPGGGAAPAGFGAPIGMTGYRGPGQVGGPPGQMGQIGQPGAATGPGPGANYAPQGMYAAQRPAGPPVQVQVHALGASAGVPPAAFHHPVPRPPNSQTGVLLGMLNDGPR